MVTAVFLLSLQNADIKKKKKLLDVYIYGDLGVPRPLNDIAAISNTKPKQLAKTYRLSVVNLDLIQKVDLINIYRQCKASLNEKTTRQAVNIMNEVTKIEISAGGTLWE